jgi:hypothetical protein
MAAPFKMRRPVARARESSGLQWLGSRDDERHDSKKDESSARRACEKLGIGSQIGPFEIWIWRYCTHWRSILTCGVRVGRVKCFFFQIFVSLMLC